MSNKVFLILILVSLALVGAAVYMSLSVWDYIRQRARDALMAGFQDALDQIERQDQPQLIHVIERSEEPASCAREH